MQSDITYDDAQHPDVDPIAPDTPQSGLGSSELWRADRKRRLPVLVFTTTIREDPCFTQIAEYGVTPRLLTQVVKANGLVHRIATVKVLDRETLLLELLGESV